MGAPNDVVGVDRLVRVVMGTMAAAYNYEENWPLHCLTILERMARELKSLLKTFGRPLGKELGTPMDPSIVGIVLKEWMFIPGQPRYVVCYSNAGWVLVRKPENVVYLLCHQRQRLLADAIGKGIGGMQLFIDACAFAVAELFRKRREQLEELEQGCLLLRMYEACDCSKWPDTLKFINGLD